MPSVRCIVKANDVPEKRFEAGVFSSALLDLVDTKSTYLYRTLEDAGNFRSGTSTLFLF